MQTEIGSKNKEIVVGLSGGIDSSIALFLLKKYGWKPIGITLKLPVWEDKCNILRENVCCNKESLNRVKKVCNKLNVPYYIIDASEVFKRSVIKDFSQELKKGNTPNPCVICNRFVKYKVLFDFAKKRGIRYVATGHYARKRFNKESRKYELLVAKDRLKDQSYYLCLLPQKWLKYIVFPLGEYTKDEVYEIASKEGFDFLTSIRQSQDFCFVSEKSLDAFIRKVIRPKNGFILDKSGKVLCTHQGIPFYTIGQRRGIGLSGGPYYVIGFDVEKNYVYVSKNKKDLFKKEIGVCPYSMISGNKLKEPMRVDVCTRYHQKPISATLKPTEDENRIKIVFDSHIFSPTVGQFAVFYKGEICLGGGKISEV